MSKVVHFIDAACGHDALLEAAQLAGAGQPLLCFGPPPGRDDSPSCFGLAVAVRTVSMARLKAARLGGVSVGEAVAQCWSVTAAGALQAAGGLAAPPVVRLARAAEPDIHGLLDLAGSCTPTVVCAHPAIAAALADAGVAAEVKVIGPLACTPPAGKTHRARSRRKLGLADHEVAIAAPGPVHRRSGHRMAVWATAILAVAEMPVRLVIRDTGRAARNVVNFARQGGFAGQVILAGADVQLPEMLAAADVAVFLGTDPPPPVHLASAMAAGLPIVPADIPAARDWLCFHDNALPAPPGQPRAIARAMMRLIEDGELASRLGDSARRTAKKQSDPKSIRRQWADLHAELALVHPPPG
jgi:hypothetical protein